MTNCAQCTNTTYIRLKNINVFLEFVSHVQVVIHIIQQKMSVLLNKLTLVAQQDITIIKQECNVYHAKQIAKSVQALSINNFFSN